MISSPPPHKGEVEVRYVVVKKIQGRSDALHSPDSGPTCMNGIGLGVCHPALPQLVAGTSVNSTPEELPFADGGDSTQ